MREVLGSFNDELLNACTGVQIDFEIIKNFTEDIENYKFNAAVAKLREFSNKLFSYKSIPKPIENYTWSIYLRLIYVFTPHFSEELSSLEDQGTSICKQNWPKYNEKYLSKQFINIVAQVNGKKKAE